MLQTSPQHESVALPRRYSHPHLRRLHSPQQSHQDVSQAGFGSHRVDTGQPLSISGRSSLILRVGLADDAR
ncbi:Uncharacterised protein [Vibrio cholerae]|nr:Uncharacterised protein [Vibrio cholerae]CSD02130.1 Uncharacterised protein [Vibrio cholerae]CSI13753.1 Uncharacterised protein [Vibrio cholerae]